jgi:hypothetical protein
MSLTRRDFLRLGGVAAVTASATACGAMGRRLAQDELPETLPVPTVAAANQVQDLASSFATDPALRLLNRAGFGPRHGELERVSQMGLEAYLEEQLNPDDIDDSTADLMIRNLNLYQMDASQLMAQEPREAAGELMAATLAL